MTARYELLTFGGNCCELRFIDPADGLVLRSAKPIQFPHAAQSAIDWLRTALRKDWLYHVFRDQRGSGPRFRIYAPRGAVFESAAFTSSDAMERAVELLKREAERAPITVDSRAACAAPPERTTAGPFDLSTHGLSAREMHVAERQHRNFAAVIIP